MIVTAEGDIAGERCRVDDAGVEKRSELTDQI